MLDRADLLKGRGGGSSLPEPRHYMSDVIVVRRDIAWWNPDLPRNPHLDLGIRILKPIRQHSNHRVRVAIHTNRFTQNGRIAVEASFEETRR